MLIEWIWMYFRKVKIKNITFLSRSNPVRMAWKFTSIIACCGTLGLLAGCTSGPLSSNLTHSPTDDNSTFGDDNHIQPVYTSPTVTPVTTNLPAAYTPP
jgi:hypothetical protein